MRQGSGGNQKWLVVLLIGIVGGFGSWNYKRNLEAERSLPRPFASYRDADLDALAAAYEQELDGFSRRHEAATGSPVRVRGAQRLDDQIREFERVQHRSRGARELANRVAEREASLNEIEREKQQREEERRFLTLFLKRAFVYRG